MTQRQLTVGVLGHVDHGKTSLVKALTGTDTDRLEEEKRRGLSIVLGFAYLDSDAGMIDFIDAPGHESFIRTMISGATGIDAVLLLVAADEGLKPQTREHFEIARLLGINHGLIVINKCDLADNELQEAAIEEARDYVQDTFLQDAPIHCVSASQEVGLENLKKGLFTLLENKIERSHADNFYLPLDRVFTMDGFGTIGTGTLRNGQVRDDDEVEIMPSGEKASIRELQVHGRKVDEAYPGQRVAINLRGVKRDHLKRGQVLIKPGSIHQTTVLHGKVRILENLPRLPKRNEPIRLLYGTEEVIGKLRVIDEQTPDSGTEILVQFRCNEAVVASTGEHFILRTCSPVMTFGGGEILDTSELLLQMPKKQLLAHLQNLQSADVEGRILAHILVAGTAGISRASLAERALARQSDISQFTKKNNAMIVNNTIIDRTAYEQLSAQALSEVETFHRLKPSQAGLELEQFRNGMQDQSSLEIIEYLIRHLCDKKKLVLEGNIVRSAEFNQEDSLSNDDKELIGILEKSVKEMGISTMGLDEIMDKDPARKRAYHYLKESGKLVPLREGNSKRMLVFHSDVLQSIEDNLIDHYPPPEKFTVADIRSLTDSTRKYVIPILEYFDQRRITVRQGDFRVIAKRGASSNE